MTEDTINETDELRKTVEALREEIERVSNRGMKNAGAPRGTFVIDTVQGFTWCADPLCKGMDVQVRATAQRETMTQSNRQRDPASDWGMSGVDPDKTENSYERFFFATEEERVCGACGRPSLEFSPQKRPRYERLSNEDPMVLLRRKREGITPEMVIDEARKKADSGELKELRDQLARQQGMLAFLMGQKSGTSQTMPPELVDLLAGTTAEPQEVSVPLTASAPAGEPEVSSKQENGLPVGVRARGSGYQCFYRRDGRQRQKGGFQSAEAAAEYRQQQLEAASAWTRTLPSPSSMST